MKKKPFFLLVIWTFSNQKIGKKDRSIIERIKNIKKDFFEKESIEKPTDNYNINELQNK